MAKKWKDLVNKELDRKVAEALGYKVRESSTSAGRLLVFNAEGLLHSNYHPSTNGQQAMDLVREFEIDVNKLRSSDEWCARVFPRKGIEAIGPTPEIAICRAVIAAQAHKGE